MSAVKAILFVAITTATVSVGCQQPQQKTYDDGGTSSTGSIGGMGSGGRELVTIPVSFEQGSSSLHLTNDPFDTGNFGFSLAAATTYSISLTDCATGYTSTATEASTALQVYKFDRNCKAKLTTFEYGGLTYEPSTDFTTWSAGDTAVFDVNGGDGSAAVNVTVLSQLANPISGTEAVVYQFSELVKGADEAVVEATVGDAHSLTVASQDPPSFTIASVAFTGVTAGGAGQFVFTLDCTADIGVTDVCANVDMSDITYKLVEDTFASTLNVAQADTIFATAGTSITLPADREDPGVNTVNGGFHTVTLDGPDAMATNPNMIFIMQSNGVSYQYFNVDVATLTQN